MKIQTTLKNFAIKPKRDTGDYLVTVTFEDTEGPGMLESIIAALGPLNKREVTIKIEPVQMRINENTGEVS